MKTCSILYILFVVILSSCQSSEHNDHNHNPITVEADSILFSFVFVGCNRVDRSDQDKAEATNATTANLYALKRIYTEITQINDKPELFFFLGDLVLGESNLNNLNSQLTAWVELFKDPSFSSISTSGIELVAVPGNHEMLYYADHKIPGHDEWPLKGATDLWLKYMAPYMPDDREHISGPDSLNNRLTFAFTRHNVGFVVMNTDTYNAPTNDHPYGKEGIIPTKWVTNKVGQFQNDPAIDHVFVLGHKPYYVNGSPQTGHQGLPDGEALWKGLKSSEVVAMLSAHVHEYQRMQPGDEGTYQVIAGNGGSPNYTPIFFGYSVINILASGKAQLISKGFDQGDPYYSPVPGNPTTTRDSTILTWEKNANPYTN